MIPNCRANNYSALFDSNWIIFDPLSFSQEFSSESELYRLQQHENNILTLEISRLSVVQRQSLISSRSYSSQSYQSTFHLESGISDAWEINSTKNTNFTLAGTTSRYPFKIQIPQSAEQMITITSDEIKNCFAPCIEHLKSGITRQLEMCQEVDVVQSNISWGTRNWQLIQYIVLGGGLFQNVHVLDSIKEEFRNVEVIELSNTYDYPKRHVCRANKPLGRALSYPRSTTSSSPARRILELKRILHWWRWPRR